MSRSEKQFYLGIFNNLDVDSIVLGVLDVAVTGEGTAAVTIGNTIMLNPNDFNYRDDITTWNLNQKSTAVHEAVHVWDSQNISPNTWINAAIAQDRALRETGSSINAYHYNAKNLSEFRNANAESRAAQVEDAWRRSVGLKSYWYSTFDQLTRSAIPGELLKKEVKGEN